MTLSWSQATLGGSQGAARIVAAMNKTFAGTTIRLNFLPGPDMARAVNQVATEFTAGQKSHTDLVLAAAAQITPVVKLGVLRPIDWPHYLGDRITPAMTELDGQVSSSALRPAFPASPTILPPLPKNPPCSTTSSSLRGRGRSPRPLTRPASTS